MFYKLIIPAIFAMTFIAAVAIIKLSKDLSDSPEVMCGQKNKSGELVFMAPKSSEIINYLTENKSCSADQAECFVTWDGGQIKLSLNSKPVVSNQNLKIRLELVDSHLVPDELDLVGISLNMGYLRPKFKKMDDRQYIAEVSLPFCEEDTMKWKASVLFKNSESASKNAVAFYFNSIKLPP